MIHIHKTFENAIMYLIVMLIYSNAFGILKNNLLSSDA